MQNIGRDHLVMRLVCTDCGGLLRLSYQGAKPNENQPCDEVETGAFKLETRVYVEPCGRCVGKAREPIEMMRKALGELLDIPRAHDKPYSQ